MSQKEIPTKSSGFKTDEAAQAGELANPNNTLQPRAACPRDQIEFNFMMPFRLIFLIANNIARKTVHRSYKNFQPLHLNNPTRLSDKKKACSLIQTMFVCKIKTMLTCTIKTALVCKIKTMLARTINAVLVRKRVSSKRKFAPISTISRIQRFKAASRKCAPSHALKT